MSRLNSKTKGAGRLGNTAKKTGRLGGGSKPDLKTSTGLLNVANTNNLQQKAQDALAGKGEQPKQIFSGGFISDVFDGLSMLQYGTVGLLKGKSFSEGVRTRQSFTDQDALGDKGIPGMIAGIALDIAFDPLTYAGGLGILNKAGKAIKGTKAVQAVGKATEASKVGQWVGRKLIYRFGQDPIYKEVAERSIRNIGVSTNAIKSMIEPMMDMKPETAAKLLTKNSKGQIIRKSLDELKGVLTDDEMWNVTKAYSVLDDLGKQAVEQKLLSKGTWEDNLGEYIKNAYTKYETGEKKGILGFMQRGIKGIKSRKDLTDEQRKALGQIENPAYLLFKSMFDLNKDIENAKFFNQVGKTFAKDTTETGFKQITAGTKRLGALAGKYVPEWMADDLNELIKPRDYGMMDKMVAGFKFGKVILNPATHIRNTVSNFILNDFEGLSPARIDIYTEAAKQLKTKGKYFEEARMMGMGADNFAAQEIKDILLNNKFGGKQVVGGIETVGIPAKYADKIANIYQKEEEFAKMAQFIFQRKKGLGVEDAWKAAERATFNYAQVTPFIRTLREKVWGFPFITFTYKATPQIVKTMATNPTKISNMWKVKQGIENQGDQKEREKERANEPGYIRDGFYVKLPGKDDEGRSKYLDLTYFLPFGDLVSGNFMSRSVGRETGIRESAAQSLLFERTPLGNSIKEIARNQDFFGNRIWNESDPQDKQNQDLFRYIVKTLLPTIVANQIPGGYKSDGTRQQGDLQKVADLLSSKKELDGTQQQSLMEILMKYAAIKIQPIEADIQETMMEWEKRKALQTTLKEGNVVKELNINYIPK